MRIETIAKNLTDIIEADESLKFLPPWQVRCLIPLALGRSISAIALEVGQSETSIREALKSVMFKEALAIASIHVYQMSGELCAAASIEAVFVLKEIMGDNLAKSSDRIKAAEVILKRGDISDRWQFSQRLSKIEESL